MRRLALSDARAEHGDQPPARVEPSERMVAPNRRHAADPKLPYGGPRSASLSLFPQPLALFHIADRFLSISDSSFFDQPRQVVDFRMADAPHYSRLVRPRLEEALADTPVVLVHGPRQCGKTTLARAVGDAAGYGYRTFDDDTLRAAAETDPVGFVADLPDRAVLDEVQRVPGLFTSLKAAVDRDRTPGRFLLTGSANVLLVPTLSDSLAGRMEILRLHPLSQHELAGRAGEVPTFVERLFRAESGSVADLGFASGPTERLGAALAETVVAGGYPAALARAAPHRRTAWSRHRPRWR